MAQSRINRTVHYPESPRQILMSILFICFVCCAFLIFFQPFGVNNYDPTEKISSTLVLAVLSLGVVCTATLSFNEFVIRRWFVKRFSAGTLILWLLWTLLLIGSASYLQYNILGQWHDWSFSSYLDFLKNMAALAAIPVVLVVLYFRQISLQHAIGEIKEAHRSTGNSQNLILFTADNQKDKLALPFDSILFLESQDNYVALSYLDGETVRKHLLRSTLKRMEAELTETSVTRCHRSFLVNPDKVTSASGNAHRMDLTLAHYPQKIPVSRNFTESITRALGKSTS